MLRDGRVFTLFAYLACTVSVFVCIWRINKSTKRPEIRKIAGIDAMEEVVGRATEMGRPVLMIPGRANLSGTTMGETLAGLAILSHVAGLAARYGAKSLTPLAEPEVLPLAQDLVRQAYIQAGRPEAYDESTVSFLTQDRWGYTAGVVGMIKREKVAGAILTGNFAGECLILAESAVNEGAILISGTVNMLQIPFFVAASDYCLIGEELIAAGVYLSKDPRQLASLVAEDWIKVVVSALILLSSVAATFGVTSISALLKK